MVRTTTADVSTVATLEVDDRSFRRLAEMARADFGIALGENKRSLLVSRLSKRLRELQLPDFAAYCQHLDGESGALERRRMCALLTTNVTRFFREAHHFRALSDQVLPPLLARARRGGRVRLWSAGCSSGEEPYSLALTLLQVCPEAARLDIRILGTDIDPEVIWQGRNGGYDLREAQVPAALREAYFEPAASVDGHARAGPDLRRLVTLAELNRIGDWPMKGRFDVIFCRNVVIYFDVEMQARLWTRFADMLAPGGYLFVGHSERVAGPATDRLVPAGVTQYRREGDGAARDTEGDLK